MDDVELPERPRTIERASEDAGDLLGELLLAAGGRQRQLAHVVAEIEVLVVDPVRVIEPERHRREAPAERRQQVQALGDELLQAGRVEHAAGCRRGVVDRKPAHVAEVAAVLQCEELRVEARQLSHFRSLPFQPVRRRRSPAHTRS